MNHSEATGVMNMISAAWPNQEMEADTIAIWVSVLTGFDRADTMTAVGRLMRTEHFFPSLAKFTEATEAEEHARRNRQAARWGLPTGPAGACPQCQGTMLVSDDQGRVWTCRCYVPGRPSPPPNVKPSPERFAEIVAEVRDRLRARSVDRHLQAVPDEESDT